MINPWSLSCRLGFGRSVRLFAEWLAGRGAAFFLVFSRGASRARGASAPLAGVGFFGRVSAMPSGFSKFSSACGAAFHLALRASPQKSRFSLARVAALALALLAAPGLHAADVTWSSAGTSTPGGDGNWTGGSTWWNGSSAVTWTASDNATFSAAGNTTVNSAVTVGNITFSSSSANISILGGAGDITLNSGITATNTANTTALTYTISESVALGANQTWTVNAGGTVGTQNLVVSGIISGANRTITKLGDGTLTLSGNNTFSGGIDFGQYTPSSIDGGTIRVEHDKALGTGQVYFQSAGTIELGTSGLTISNIMNVYNRGSNNARIFTLDLAGTATGTFSGKFDMRKGGTLLKFNVGTGDTLTVSGNITNGAGVGGFEKTGAGTLVLTGAGNDYNGSTVISAGTLQIGAGGTTGSLTTNNNAVTNNGTLVFNRSDNITVANAIGGTGNLIKQASNTLTLSGNNTYTGTTTVSAGTMTLSGNLTTAGAVYVNGAANPVLNITGNLTSSNAGGARTLQIAASAGNTGTVNVSGSGILNLTGGGMMLGENGGGNATFNQSGGTVTLAGSTTWMAGNGSTLNISGGNFSTAGQSFYIGGGPGNITNTITVNGTGQMTIGTLIFGQGGAGATSIVNLGTGSAGGNLSISGIIRTNGTNTINFNGGTLTTSGAITISSAIADTVVKSGGAVFNVASNTLTISNNLTTDGTGGGLTKNGTGTLTLSGSNTYTGTTTINTGTLTLSGGNAIVDTGAVSVSSGAVLNLSSSETIGSIAGAGNVTLGSNTLTAGGDNTSTTFSGNISGTGGLTKAGTGTLTLSNAANTYSGTTTINAGTLDVTGSAASSATIVNSGGTLLATGTAGATTVNSGGTLTGTGTVGAVTLNTGGLIGAGTGTSTVGKLTGSSLSIGSSSGYAFTIGNVNASVAGTDYDQISLSGALTFSNTAANPFTVYLYGTPTGWSNTGIYSWDLITGATSMDDFAAGSFATDFTNFGIAAGSRNGTWSFSSPTDGTIRLTYSGSAGTSTWNTATGSWNTAAQWSENAIPVNNNSLLFTGSGGTATNNISDSTLTAVNNITFESGAGAYTLAASAGSAGASGGTALAVAGSITNNSTNLQTLNTAISLASSSIINAASGNITIGGVISGAGGITKSGANSLTLSTANTYSGGTALNAGTLNIGNATAIGTGTLTITSGTLDNTSGGALTLSNNNAQNWNGNFTVAGTNDLNMGTGNVTLGATPTVTVSAGNLTVGGIISGSSRGLTKAGSGTMILTGNNTYTGTTTISAGTLQVGGSNGNIAGAIVNNANLLYTSSSFGVYGVTGSGNLTINQSSGNVYLQGNITQSGTVNITTSTATTTSGMIQAALGTNNVNRMNTSITASAITINGMIGAFQDNSRILTLDTSASNGAITLDLQNGSSGTWNPVSIIANAGTGNITLSGTKANTTNNAPWTANTANSFTGAINISSNFLAGTLNLNATGNSSVSGNLTLGTNSTSTWNVASGLTMTTSGLVSGNNASITKNGTGTLILSNAANTYNGSTTVNAGTLQLSGNISSSALTLNSGGIISVGTNTTIAKYNTSSITIGAGSGYIFTIGSNASGTTAGTDYDQLTATGALTFNNTAASPFTVYVNGSPTNWSNTGNYTWNIMSGASIAGFNSGNFVANMSSFGIASANRTGTWSFGTSGGNLTLSYTLATPDYFWDGGSGNWTDSYSAGVRGFTPSAPTPDDNLYFTGSGGTVTNNIASGNLSAVNFITFNSTAGAYTLAAAAGAAGAAGGTALTVKGDIINNSASNQAISMALAFGASSSGVINTAAGNITLSGNLSGTSVLTKTGTGTLTLSGASKTNTGGLVINGGNVSLTTAQWAANMTINAGGTLTPNFHYSSGANLGANSPSLTINGGTLNGNGLYTEPGLIILNNATITGSNGGGLMAVLGWTANGNNTISQQVNVESGKAASGNFDIQSGTTTISSIIINYASRFRAITKNGSGTLVLSGANTFGDGVVASTLNAGTLVLNNNTALGNTTLTINGGTLDNTSGSAKTLTNNNTQSWNGDFTFLGTNGSLNIGTGAVTMNASRTVTVSNGTFTVGGAIGGATFGLTKNGSGTLVLSGANTYNGTTTVNAGTITLGAADRIADTSNLNVAGGTFNLGGFNETLGSITGSGNITLGAGTLTTNSSSNTTFSGIISGTGGLTKNGSSTLTLSGNNSYNGTTTINTGTLLISTTGQLGGGNYSGNISNTGTFRYNSTANQTLGGIISGNGALVKNAASTLTLSGNNTYTGTTTITGGTLQISSTGLLGGGNYSANISNDGTLLLASNSNQTLGGVISGSGALTKNGNGTLTLTNTNTYSGATAINSGTLVVNGSAANSAVTIGNGGILGGNGTVGALTVQSGGRVAPGNSPGNLNASTLTLQGGGGYNWEITNVAGTAGTDWDLITVGGGTGAATISATSGNKFTIYISGNPVGWDTNSSYDWNIIDWGTATGFDANAFAVDTTGFTGTAPVGTWTFSNTAGYLNLAYTVASDPIWSGGTGNWTTGFSPALTTGNKSITFAGAAGGTATNNIASGTVGSVAGITFNSTAGAYTLAADSGSAGYDTASALQLNGNILNNSTATQTINLALTSTATRVYDAAAGNLTIGGAISGTGGLTKNGSNLLTLSANNTYTGDTTINAGTVEIASTGLLGGGNYTGNIANAGAFLIGSNSNQTLGGVISGIGALTKNGTGTLTLAGNNNYSGGTTLNTGTLVIGNAAAAGTGTITQANGSSLLKIDTTGTIMNDMSVYNVLASQSATLSGAITVNNATWDIDTGDTLTISGAVSGNGGVTKNGGGTLTLNGTNTYNGSTVVNAGTLNAASAGALGNNATVQVTGGSLLVSADNALNNKSLTLNSTSIAGLAFSGNYSGRVNNLTLSQNSIIDLGDGSVSIMFDTFVMNSYTLDIYNWTGTTLWGGGTGNDTDKVYFGPDLSDTALAKIYFHSGAVGGGDSFLGSGFELMPQTTFDGGLGYQIIPVPEPETYATGLLLLLGGAWWMWRKRSVFTT